ncbi:hypothetical protein [Shewanella algae]|uniref:hypothetical protein n=1 Tax=Shewanella algae TaxID=38313 RepID=UPI0031F4D90A
MRIVHFRDAYQEDIPIIVTPDKAAGYIREYLSRRPGFYETIFGIDSFLYDAGVHYAPAPYQIESIMERISWQLESGDYLLLGDREDGFDTILFFGDISPFVSSTFRERVKRLPPRPQYGYGNYSKAQEPIIEPDTTPAPEAPAELKETGITKAINAMMGGAINGDHNKNGSSFDEVFDNVVGAAKQLANDAIASQRSMLAEHLSSEGVIQFTDSGTGELLSSSEVAERYLDTEDFNISERETNGANRIKEIPSYSSILLAANTIGSKGRNLLRSSQEDALISGVLKEASKVKGNKTLKGEFTKEQVEKIGHSWVGENATLASDGKTWVSSDKMRQYRPPSKKPKSSFAKTGYQANLERRFHVVSKNNDSSWIETKAWQGNSHLNVKVEK